MVTTTAMRVGDLLRRRGRDVDGVGTAALRRDRRANAGRAAATGALIADAAISALDEDLGELLVATLDKYRSLRAAAQESLAFSRPAVTRLREHGAP